MAHDHESIETVDQTSSVTLLGVAVGGALLMLAAYWITGG